MWSVAKTSAATDGSITLRGRCWISTVHRGPALERGRRHPSDASTRQTLPGQQTEFALLRESLGVSRVNYILRVHGHTILQEQRAAEVHDEIGQRSLEQLFPGLTKYKRPSAQASLELGSKERETSLLRHTWGLSSQPNRASRL